MTRTFFAISLLLLFIGRPRAQEIARDEYLKYVPLHYARLVPQNAATNVLQLYGDRTDPSYRDVDPVDGIDDDRHRVLMSLAVRFAPYLVQNTTNMPTNFDMYIDNSTSFPLHLDTWEISGEVSTVVQTGGINFSALGNAQCGVRSAAEAGDARTPPSADGTTEDCKLVALLDEFSPYAPKNSLLTDPLVRHEPDLLTVMYFNFPGQGPGTWELAYRPEYDRTPEDRRDRFPHSYVHPFLARVDDDQGSLVGYELVLQYWFFYPSNDGGNNHEGDWEHMNVVVAPKSMVERPLSAETVDRILTGDLPATDDARDPLVIRRAEYYFHHFVMTLDFSSPNVYAPRDEWKADVRSRPTSRFQEVEIWEDIRHLAYVDDEETIINTHPLGYIGADNKGFDQALAAPGGKNRDSHGTYPFPGRFISIGPAGATEQISANVDPRKLWKNLREGKATAGPAFKRGHVLGLADPRRLRIIPDWERIIEYVHTDARARRDWSWLILPILWGYPATESPFAGIIDHADSGNLPPVGPSYNAGWNVSGPARGFHAYEPHKLPSVFPLRPQDSFRNDFGFFNFTLPVLFNLPPLDFLSRIVSYPFELAFGNTDPVYYPKEGVPFRFVGLSSGVSVQNFDDDFSALSFNSDQYDEFILRILGHLIQNGADSTTVATGGSDFMDNTVGPFIQVAFYIGSRFASENTVRNMRPSYGVTLDFNNIPSYTYLAEINYWEYAGSIRYSLTSSRLQPFVKGGYGWSWYRLENVQADGEPFDTGESRWIKPRFWPNVWHLGLGIEFTPWKRVGKFPGGTELAFRFEYARYFQNLNLDLSGVTLERLGIAFSTLGDVPGSDIVTRDEFLFGITLSF